MVHIANQTIRVAVYCIPMMSMLHGNLLTFIFGLIKLFIVTALIVLIVIYRRKLPFLYRAKCRLDIFYPIRILDHASLVLVVIFLQARVFAWARRTWGDILRWFERNFTRLIRSLRLQVNWTEELTKCIFVVFEFL